MIVYGRDFHSFNVLKNLYIYLCKIKYLLHIKYWKFYPNEAFSFVCKLFKGSDLTVRVMCNGLGKLGVTWEKNHSVIDNFIFNLEKACAKSHMLQWNIKLHLWLSIVAFDGSYVVRLVWLDSSDLWYIATRHQLILNHALASYTYCMYASCVRGWKMSILFLLAYHIYTTSCIHVHTGIHARIQLRISWENWLLVCSPLVYVIMPLLFTYCSYYTVVHSWLLTWQCVEFQLNKCYCFLLSCLKSYSHRSPYTYYVTMESLNQLSWDFFFRTIRS